MAFRTRGQHVLFSNVYKRYMLGVVTLVCTLNNLDRGLIGLLLQPIKEDLSLSDTQLGFLTGIAFGLFYATLGLPIARRADRGNRVNITSIAIGLWGVTVMLCMFVGNFVQLLLARIAAAIGESGCLPVTYSLVGDYFPAPAERTRAMSIFMLASPLSSLVSFMAGGWLNDRFGWRVTFFVMGIPALMVAALVKITITEPRMHLEVVGHSAQRLPPMTKVLATLWQQRSSRHLSLAIILIFTMALGLWPWYAAFMIRSHGMSTAELGAWLGLIFGLGGSVGTLLGGYVTARWFADDARRQLRLSAIMIASVIPCYILFLFLPNKNHALIALVPLMLVLFFFIGPAFSMMQRLVASEMRATALALVMLFANLIGMGLGPQIVGILSDSLRPRLGTDSLRYAMLIMSLVALWSAYHFWQGGRTAKDDLVRCERGA